MVQPSVLALFTLATLPPRQISIRTSAHRPSPARCENNVECWVSLLQPFPLLAPSYSVNMSLPAGNFSRHTQTQPGEQLYVGVVFVSQAFACILPVFETLLSCWYVSGPHPWNGKMLTLHKAIVRIESKVVKDGVLIMTSLSLQPSFPHTNL